MKKQQKLEVKGTEIASVGCISFANTFYTFVKLLLKYWWMTLQEEKGTGFDLRKIYLGGAT